MVDKRRLIIIDELLQNIDGHNFEYIKSVKEIFETQNYDISIYGNDKVIDNIKGTINAIPWFKIHTNPFYRKVPIIGAIIFRLTFWVSLFKQYKACIIHANINKQHTQMFIPNIFWYNLLPIILSIRFTNIRTVILFRISTQEIPDAPKSFHSIINKIFNYASKCVNKNPNIILATDSAVIANEWIENFGSNMIVLPIPHIHPSENILASNNFPKRFRFYAPGVMRLEKGMELMMKTFQKIDIDYVALAKKIHWVLQIFGNRDKEIFDKFRLQLKILKNVDVEILGSLTSEEYNSEMMNADVILIPYQLDKGYRARTSGVLCETIGAQKPFITTDNTWMSEQGKTFDTGYYLQNENVEELILLIEQIILNYSEMKAKAVLASDKFLEFHSGQNFFLVFCG